MSVDHYENFPVASLLCPKALRPPITAIYWYARTADDLADEGEAGVAERLADLSAYRVDLHRAARRESPSPRWHGVFTPLASAIERHRLPVHLLEALLSAFEQDLVKRRYADRRELLDYCERSANPVGRLLLHLHGVGDAAALAQSDAICSALQLINFAQDLRIDLTRDRLYLPLADVARHGLAPESIMPGDDTPALRRAVADFSRWARQLMLSGSPLVHRLPGRSGLELRLVVQGGLRILDKIEALGYATVRTRPKLRAPDVAAMLWKALGMRAGSTLARSEAA